MLKSVVPMLSLAVCAGFASDISAAEIEMYFQATIDDITDEFEGQARVGDILDGVIYFDTTTPESNQFPGNYPFAVTSFDIFIIPQSGPNQDEFIFLLGDGGIGDIFVGTNSFEIDYFFDIFSGNFALQLNEGPDFNQSLETAGQELVQATEDSPFGDALDAFTDPFENSSFTIQTDYTFGNTFATFNFVQFTRLYRSPPRSRCLASVACA